MLVGNSVEMANYSSGYRGMKSNGYGKKTYHDEKYKDKKNNIALDDERHCSYHDNTSHSRDSCFKLIGYP